MATGSYGAPVRQALEFFGRTLSIFTEADSGYAPTPTQFTVAQQVAHVAQTIDWYLAGGFRPSGFDLDFTSHNSQVREVTSLAEARAWLERAVEDAVKTLEGITPEKMMEPLPEGPILGGEPRAAVVGAICEHTAHHRGSLAVYGRMLGRKPPVPYAD